MSLGIEVSGMNGWSIVVVSKFPCPQVCKMKMGISEVSTLKSYHDQLINLVYRLIDRLDRDIYFMHELHYLPHGALGREVGRAVSQFPIPQNIQKLGFWIAGWRVWIHTYIDSGPCNAIEIAVGNDVCGGSEEVCMYVWTDGWMHALSHLYDAWWDNGGEWGGGWYNGEMRERRRGWSGGGFVVRIYEEEFTWNRMNWNWNERERAFIGIDLTEALSERRINYKWPWYGISSLPSKPNPLLELTRMMGQRM